MLAIQRLNPEAFINNNINLLRRGQVLRIPSESDIYEVDQRQAVNEVAYQNAQWNGSEQEAELQSTRSSGAVSGGSSNGAGRVSLAAPEKREDVSSARGSGQGGSRESLENELAITLEELDRTQRENKDLASRVVELEAQIQTMERLVKVSNAEVAALEQSIRDRKEQTSGVVASEMEPAAAAETVEQPPQAANAVPDAPQTVEKPAPADSKTVVSRSKPAPTFMDKVMDNIIYIGGAVAALLAAVVYFLRRRKEEEDVFDEFDDDEPLIVDEDHIDDGYEEDLDDEQVADDASGEEQGFDEEDTATIESQTGDAVSEADIYIAYGKYDQAEEMLLNALATQPGNAAVLLKLLEVYSETENLAAFDQHYAGLRADGDAQSIERAEELRAMIPDAGEFDESAIVFESQDTQVSNLSDDAIDLDLSDITDSQNALIDEDTENSASESEDYDLDFDLGGDDTLLSDSVADESFAGETGEESLSLDDGFSLDDEVTAADDEADTLAVEFDSEPENVDEGALAFEESAGTEEDAGIDAAELALDDEADLPVSLDLSEEASSDITEDTLEADLGGEFDDLALDDSDVELSLEDDLGDEDLAGLDTELNADLDTLDMDSEDDLSLELAEDDSVSEDITDLDAALDYDVASRLDEDAADLEFEDTREPVVDANLSDEEFDLALDVQEGRADEAELETLSMDDEVRAGDDFAVEQDEADASLVGAAVEPDFTAVDDDISFDLEGDDELGSSEADSDELSTLDTELAELGDLDLAEEGEELSLGDDDATLITEAAADDAESTTSESLEMDEVFSEALSDVPEADESFDFAGEDADVSDDDELDFLAEADEVATKLDLARAYIDMGDRDGAKDILDEVVAEGNDEQRQEAEELIGRI